MPGSSLPFLENEKFIRRGREERILYYTKDLKHLSMPRVYCLHCRSALDLHSQHFHDAIAIL